MAKKMDSCIFCKIANGSIPSYKVYEDNDVIAFLDISPASRGHTLVVTKEHFDDMTRVPKDILAKAYSVAQLIAQAEITELGATGVNVLSNIGASAGQSVRHFHIHVIPRYDNDGLKLAFPPHKLEDKDMLLLQDSIRKGM
jgi:histidine triad (HIT) family protein